MPKTGQPRLASKGRTAGNGRKPLSTSLRWQVFARDGFRCRYCGAQAGEPGVVLHADHVVSVADGGTNRMDNLVAACQKCNGGKSARSLDGAPGCAEAVAFAEAQTASLRQQAEAIAANMKARTEAKQAVFELLCDAYGRRDLFVTDRHLSNLVAVLEKHGPERLADWIGQAARRRVLSAQVDRYVHGIIRTIARERGGVV